MSRFIYFGAVFMLVFFPALSMEAFAAGSLPLDSLEVGVSAVGGPSLVGGDWRDEVDAFSADLGQDTETGLFPGFAASLFASARFGPLWSIGLSLGAGSWGGRVSSEGGSSGDRFSTIAGIGVELLGDGGIRLPFGPGEFGADLKFGLGFLVSPLRIREAWAETGATSAYDLSANRRLYYLTGADLSYAFPVGIYSVAALLSADVGFATFDPNADMSILGRFGVGVRLSRAFALNKGKRR